MSDFEKVIKGLEQHMKAACASVRGELKPVFCPYFQESHCITDLCRDALELLKEQELKEPTQEAQRDYEAASDVRDYCERYEPTYNSDDSSM